MKKLNVDRIVLGSCQTNCYYLYEEGTDEAIFIDPADEGGYLYQTVTAKGLKIAGILLTHGHFDHILGAEELRRLSGAEIYAYEVEKAVCENPSVNLSAMFGQSCSIVPDHYLKDEAEFILAGRTIKLLATPGHTVGSCCYYLEEDGILISGDTLFQESVGRTDFPTGSMSILVHSLEEKLAALPDEVAVYPGHGDMTTIGYEKQYNPYWR